MIELNNIVQKYVENHIGEFHNAKINSLYSLKLQTVIQRKNPYLFKAKNMLTADSIVHAIIDAHISSNEETIFGTWLEGLVIYICKEMYGGWKSGIKGIDLEFDKDGIRYIVNIKSGPNWGNAAQISKMVEDFKSAKKTLRTSKSELNVVAVNGCCYGKDKKPDKGDYYKYCGQKFWTFISGSDSLYIDLIEPLGFEAKKKNDDYLKLYSMQINKFTREFIEQFCDLSGEIDWKIILRTNSGST